MSEADGTIRLLLAARVRLYREELASLIEAQPGHVVVGVAATAHDCVDECARLRPDVVLLDVDLGAPGAVVSELRRQVPAPAVIALAVAHVEPDLIALAEAGVTNFVTLDDSFETLMVAIDATSQDGVPCSPWVAGALLRRVREAAAAPGLRGGAPALTRREWEVADLLAAGLSNKEIGRELCIELPTVKNHVHNVLDKLHVNRRTEAGAAVRGVRGH